MAFTPLSKDMNIIAALPDEPNTAGYTAAQFKAKFDEGILAIKEFLNTRLIAELSSSQGAGNIGIDDIAGYTAEDIQTALEQIAASVMELPSFPLSVANGGTGASSAAAAPSSLGAASASDLAEHEGAENPHNITRTMLSVTEQGKLLIGETEYTLQIGTAEDAAEGYITFVLEPEPEPEE